MLYVCLSVLIGYELNKKNYDGCWIGRLVDLYQLQKVYNFWMAYLFDIWIKIFKLNFLPHHFFHMLIHAAKESPFKKVLDFTRYMICSRDETRRDTR